VTLIRIDKTNVSNRNNCFNIFGERIETIESRQYF